MSVFRAGTVRGGAAAEPRTFRCRLSRALRVLTVASMVGAVVSVAPGLTASSSAATNCNTAPNPVVCENTLPGTPESVWDISGAGDTTIQGFSTAMSVNLGDTESFKINTNAKAYTIDIYRLGYYQGNGARLIASILPTAKLPQAQPGCISDPVTYNYDCGTWGVSASWTVPATAVSGVYIATLTRTDTGGKSQIPFVVRNDASHSSIVYQTSDPTWEAYNSYGGSDFYTGGGNVGRAYAVSYNRPIVTRNDNSGQNSLFSNEYPAIRFLEENGYDVSYISGVDTDRNGSLLLNHKIFLSVGHDEYWSAGQRSNVEAARNAGVSLTFLSGNEVYWRTRWANSIDGSNTAYRTLVSYKETWADAPIDPLEPAVSTSTWRDPRFGTGADPENGLTGTMYMSNTGGFAIQVPSTYSKDRLWRNTAVASLAPGQTATLAPNTLGYEFDSDVDNGSRPAGLIDLSSTTEQVAQKMEDYGSTVAPGSVTHSLTLYRAPSGALVFGAGTVQWAWGLDSDHDGVEAPASPVMQQAMVNLFADMGVQPATLMSGLVPASKSTDTTAPVPVIVTPTSTTAVTVGVASTVSGTATDAGGGVVAGVEVSSDSGVTWHPASGTSTWTYSWTPTVSGPTTIEVRATDDSANMSAPAKLTVSVAPRGCPCSIWSSSTLPPPPFTPATSAGEGSTAAVAASTPDSNAVELGVKFQTSSSGYVTGIKFYKASANVGVHTGSLWTASGSLLATATFSGETATGWQTVLFSNPVAVTANTTYVAGYYAPQGNYTATAYTFQTAGVTSEPLVALSGAASGGNGLYSYGSNGIFPSSVSPGDSNYWVDVMFTRPGDGPTVTSSVPVASATNVSGTAAVTATFSQAVTASSIAFSVKTADDVVAGTTSYNSATNTASFVPSVPFAGGTTYAVSVTAAAVSSGAPVAPAYSWSFTTAAAAPTCPCSIWSASATPANPSANEALPITLGVRFTSSANGYITGVRFYKGSQNTGTHTGSLWTNTGALLGTATFTSETVSGWQTVLFATPVSISAGVTYVAGYYAPNGGYAADPGYFSTSGVASGPLVAPAAGDINGNGVFSYGAGGGYPSDTFGATNYWVDPVFAGAGAGLTVASTSPTPNATNVAITGPLTATFSQPVTSTSVVFTVSSNGSVISGTTAYNPATSTATFSPSVSLLTGAIYSVSVTAASQGTGIVIAPAYQWSFTTAGPPSCPCSLWPSSTPAISSVNDPSSVELGVKFSSGVNGFVTGVRFYKGSGNTGTHTGSLWTSSGTLLATATFAGETGSGWQNVNFASPVAVTAGTTYIAGYYAPNGGYSANSGYFSTSFTSGPLSALSSSAGGNGLYLYGAGGGFPTNTYNSTNYWVDVVFNQSAGSLGTGPGVSTTNPTAGTTGVVATQTVGATFDQQVTAGSVAFTLTGGGATVAGSTAFNPATNTVTFTPAAPLTSGTMYFASTSATSAVTGLQMAAPYSWSFTTAGSPPPACPCSVWSNTAIPASPTIYDSSSVELGMQFTTTVSGHVSGVRFYKGDLNTGTHTGSLWTTSGALLATATFSNETATGWQTVLFSNPVAVTAGTDYVVSYYAPNGHYSADGGYFAASGVSASPLIVPTSGPVGGNGLYGYGQGGTMPTSTYNGTNYWVDVVFVAS